MERGFLVVTFCSIAIAGGMPSMESTSGFVILPRNCLAYDDRLSETSGFVILPRNCLAYDDRLSEKRR